MIKASNNISKIWQINKKYKNSDYKKNYNIPIDVYLNSINNTIEEYLVNFKFLVDIMKKNNLVLLEEDELKKIGINKSEGLFSELYDDKYNLEKEEKEISFMFRYFIFKKMK